MIFMYIGGFCCSHLNISNAQVRIIWKVSTFYLCNNLRQVRPNLRIRIRVAVALPASLTSSSFPKAFHEGGAYFSNIYNTSVSMVGCLYVCA